MTTSIDIKALAAAKQAMARVGGDATFYQFSSAAYNILTMQVDEGAPTETALKIIPPYRNSKGFTLSGVLQDQSFFAPEALLSGIAGDALTTPPKVGDEIGYGNQRFKIVQMEPIRSGDDVALYLFRIDEIRSVS